MASNSKALDGFFLQFHRDVEHYLGLILSLVEHCRSVLIFLIWSNFSEMSSRSSRERLSLITHAFSVPLQRSRWHAVRCIITGGGRALISLSYCHALEYTSVTMHCDERPIAIVSVLPAKLVHHHLFSLGTSEFPITVHSLKIFMDNIYFKRRSLDTPSSSLFPVISVLVFFLGLFLACSVLDIYYIYK